MELKETSDISNALSGVEIAIGFLTSTITPADKEQPYEKYLRDVLRMDVSKYIPSRKVGWLLLFFVVSFSSCDISYAEFLF